MLHVPDRRIDTFGSTEFDFVLISELLDKIDQVRIRSGKITAERPRILRPEPYQELNFDGFGEQAEAFQNWLKSQRGGAAFLQYGFAFKKSEVTESLLHEKLDTVQARLVEEAIRVGNPRSAIIAGVDDAWEICLLKFTVEMIQKSSGINIFDFKRRGLL